MASKRKRCKQAPEPDRHLTAEEAPAFLDAWAREQNEIVDARRRIIENPRLKDNLFKDAARGYATQAGSDRGGKKVKAWKSKLGALLIAAMKKRGYEHPDTYFDPEGRFRFDDALAAVLAAPGDEVVEYVEAHPWGRPPQRPEGMRPLKRRRVLKYVEAALRHWTRAVRDREWEEAAAADETLGPAVRTYRAEKAKRIPKKGQTPQD